MKRIKAPEGYMTRTEVGAYFGVSLPTVLDWVGRYGVPEVRFQNVSCWRLEDVEAVARRRMHGQG